MSDDRSGLATSDTSIPLNRERAWELVTAIEDPVLRRLMKDALGVATKRFVHWDRLTDEEYRRQLPAAPFDLAFYVDVVRQLFVDRGHLLRVLAGDVHEDLSDDA